MHFHIELVLLMVKAFSFEAQYFDSPFSPTLYCIIVIIMVAIDRFGHVYPSVHLQDMLQLAQKPSPLAVPTQYGNASNDPVANFMNGDGSQKISPSQFGLDANNPSLQFSTPGGGFVQVFGPLRTPNNDKFFHDPNPVVIQKKIKTSYLRTKN